jgi:hypothetical protein
MLREGEIALLADDAGVAAINAVAHELGLVSVPLLRGEKTLELQHDTVMTYAEALPLVWVGDEFGATVTDWARARGPMTLLVETNGALSDDQRRRIDRFVATLGRQSE